MPAAVREEVLSYATDILGRRQKRRDPSQKTCMELSIGFGGVPDRIAENRPKV